MSSLIKNIQALLLLFIFTYSVVINAQVSQWESGKIEVQKRDTSDVDELLKKANQLRYSNPDSSLILAEEAIELAQKLVYYEGEALGLKTIGIVKYDSGNFLEAEINFKKSMEIFKSSGDIRGLSNLQNNIGSVYRTVGDYPKALDYFINSLRNAQVVKDSQRIGTVYVNMGSVYSEDEETYPQAIENYRNAIDIFENIGYDEGVAYATINFGEWNLNTDNPEEAITYLERTLEIFRKYEVDPSPVLNFLGEAHLKLKQYDEAQKLHNEALAAAQEKNNVSEAPKAYIGLGNTYLSMNQYARAIDFYKKGLELAEHTGVLEDKKDGYEGLAEAFSALNDYRNAFTAQQQFALLQDSIRSEGYAEMMSRMSSLYALDMHNQKEIERLNLHRQKKNYGRTRAWTLP